MCTFIQHLWDPRNEKPVYAKILHPGKIREKGILDKINAPKFKLENCEPNQETINEFEKGILCFLISVIVTILLVKTVTGFTSRNSVRRCLKRRKLKDIFETCLLGLNDKFETLASVQLTAQERLSER